MKKRMICPILAAAVVLAGCGERVASDISQAHLRSSIIPPASVTSSEIVVSAVTSVSEKQTAPLTETVTGSTDVSSVMSSASAKTEQDSSQIQVITTTAIAENFTGNDIQTEREETAAEDTAETETSYDMFYGVLIDEDCSDFEDPPLHDTLCMFMKECRESGYGLDIQQEDGSWVFYMFDENGQMLAWEYLNQTERQDGLFVTVTGIWDGNVIEVIKIEES